MGNIHKLSVIHQCFSYLDHDFSSILSDYRVHKLTTQSCLKLMVAAQLGKWDSLRTTSMQIRSSKESTITSINEGKRSLRDNPLNV